MVSTRREKHREHHRAYVERQREKWIAEHGSMPLCECGCGVEVAMASNGSPSRFRRGHRSKKADRREAFAEWNSQRWDDSNSIDKTIFFATLDRLRRQKGWTWKELAAECGMNHHTLNAMRSAKKRKRVSKQWAALILRRLAGEPTPPTRYEQRLYEEIERNERAWEREERKAMA